MFVHIGGSITGRNQQEAADIVKDVRRLCSILDRLGHSYDAAILDDIHIHKDVSRPDIDIPAKYLNQVSDAVVRSISGLRDPNRSYQIAEEIASYQWSMDLLNRAGACIWVLSYPSTGSGFEIAHALQLRKPCLVLYRFNISSVVNGSTSRLLTVRKWGDNLETLVEKFIKKAEQAFDRVIRFNSTRDMSEWIEAAAKQHPFKSISEFLRFLVEQEQKKSDA